MRSVLLVMYNWLNGFYRVMNGKYSVTLLFFGSNSRRASLLRPRPSTVSMQVPYKEVERQQNLFNQSHRVHITPLVIHGLGGGHTHTQTHTYIRTEVILRNQARAGLRPARAWFKNSPSLMDLYSYLVIL